MKREELPEIEYFSQYDWMSVLPYSEADGYNSSVYSGTYSVIDGAQVEDVDPARFLRIDAIYAACDEGWADTDFVCLVELTDGGWAACMAWCDTTGWDCRSGVQWKWAPTRELAISQGLDREARNKLGLSIAEDEVTRS